MRSHQQNFNLEQNFFKISQLPLLFTKFRILTKNLFTFQQFVLIKLKLIITDGVVVTYNIFACTLISTNQPTVDVIAELLLLLLFARGSLITDSKVYNFLLNRNKHELAYML